MLRHPVQKRNDGSYLASATARPGEKKCKNSFLNYESTTVSGGVTEAHRIERRAWTEPTLYFWPLGMGCLAADFGRFVKSLSSPRKRHIVIGSLPDRQLTDVEHPFVRNSVAYSVALDRAPRKGGR